MKKDNYLLMLIFALLAAVEEGHAIDVLLVECFTVNHSAF